MTPASTVAPSEPLVSLRGVSKDYESGAGVVHALSEVSLDIVPGEFLAIIGTSGSGKSTLMNLLGCLDRPTEGTYLLSGIDVGRRGNDARALVRNRLIGFIFQGFNLLPRTTAQENVELPLHYRGVGKKERETRARAALAAVGLEGRMHHTPNQLSGGQQQRVAIARALVTSPPLLLADEPTGNLDTRTSLEVLALLQRLNRERGLTTILVTHEPEIAACASRVITMRDGRIVSDVRQTTPHDAEAELSKLGAEAPRGKLERGALRPSDELLRRLGGPVPKAGYVGMVLGSLFGLLLGALYNQVILGVSVAAVTATFAFVTESWLGARLSRRSLGRPLTHDQRWRLALAYTLGSFGVLTVLLFLWFPAKIPYALSERLEHVSSGGALLSLTAFVLLSSCLTLLRYLLLSLFTPKAS